jgi:hypothetical protein
VVQEHVRVEDGERTRRGAGALQALHKVIAQAFEAPYLPRDLGVDEGDRARAVGGELADRVVRGGV